MIRTLTATMPIANPGDQSFFEPSNRRLQAVSSESSDTVSPTSSLRKWPKSRTIKLPPPPWLFARSQSDQATVGKVRIQTIEEGVVHTYDPRVPSATHSVDDIGRLGKTHKPESERNTITGRSSYSLAAPGAKIFQKPHPPASASKSKAFHKTLPRVSWARTTSGSVWYSRRSTSTPRDDGSSSKSYFSRPVHDEPPTSPIIPLRPPQTPERSSVFLGNQNRVTMETPFSDLPSGTASSKNLSTPGANRARKSSINPKRIFSAPFLVVRKITYLKSRAAARKQATRQSRLISSSEAQDHRSLLKREQTGAVLERVSSLLGVIKPTPLAFPGIRTMSELSESSQESQCPATGRHQMTKGMAMPVNIFKNRSTVNVADTKSYSSSLVSMKMGATPKNTPDDKATYSIKRSPSAETEEFLKIDISIRGETSYLPSEARRINTPPLPQEDSAGGRRGFFFDYNAPRGSYGIDSSQKTRSGDIESKSVMQHSTVGRAYPSIRAERKIRMKAGDWYDAQLAELDSSGSEENECELSKARSQQPHEENPENNNITSPQYEQQLDYNIPEHLPSSPLCPRHPKYWRVIQGRGSQFRGCWMHGYGMYDQIPGLKPIITPVTNDGRS